MTKRLEFIKEMDILADKYPFEFKGFVEASILKRFFEHKHIEKEALLKFLQSYQPYPKDIFKWKNKEKLDFNRGRFNQQCHKIVENMKEDIIAEFNIK